MRYETPGSETKNFITATAVARALAFSCTDSSSLKSHRVTRGRLGASFTCSGLSYRRGTVFITIDGGRGWEKLPLNRNAVWKYSSLVSTMLWDLMHKMSTSEPKSYRRRKVSLRQQKRHWFPETESPGKGESLIWLSCSFPEAPPSIFFFFLISQLFFFSFSFYFFFWLHWVFVAACGLSLVAASGGYSLLRCVGFSLRWLLLLWSTGPRASGLQ